MNQDNIVENWKQAKREYLGAVSQYIKAEAKLINFEQEAAKVELNKGRFMPSSFLSITKKDVFIMNEALYHVWQTFEVPPHLIFGYIRKREIINARHCMFYLLSKYCSCSDDTIGRICSLNRTKPFDHAIVMHASAKVEGTIHLVINKKVDDWYGKKCIEVEENLKQSIENADTIGN